MNEDNALNMGNNADLNSREQSPATKINTRIFWGRNEINIDSELTSASSLQTISLTVSEEIKNGFDAARRKEPLAYQIVQSILLKNAPRCFPLAAQQITRGENRENHLTLTSPCWKIITACAKPTDIYFSCSHLPFKRTNKKKRKSIPI